MMKKLWRPCACFLGLLLAAQCTLLAQPSSDLFEKAPPHVDEALRARVSFFYQAHVDGKFRLADSAVHEDSKDAFFVADKNRYKGFDVVKINYNAEFDRATVIVAVQSDFFMPGAGKVPVTIPLTTTWVLDADQWWWHIEPASEGEAVTPFGVMKPGEENDTSSPHYRLQHMPGKDDIASQVRVSKTSVTLDCEAGSTDEIVVSNGMPGPIQLGLGVDQAEGFQAKVEKPELGAKEEGKILFSCAAGSELSGRTLSGLLAIQPTNHQIPIQITVVSSTHSRQ